MSNASNEAAIRALMDDWATAVHSKDIDRIMTFYASDMVAYDLTPPLQFPSAAAYRKNWETYLPMMGEQIGYEVRDVRIGAGDNIAYSHCLNHFTGTEPDGKEMDVWMRVTDCYQKIGGKWLITHEHMSVPADMERNEALFELKPE